MHDLGLGAYVIRIEEFDSQTAIARMQSILQDDGLQAALDEIRPRAELMHQRLTEALQSEMTH